MGTANLCKCTNCNNILIYTYPQNGGKEYDLSNFPNALKMKYLKEGVGYWACSLCLTDEYIIDEIRDITPITFLKWVKDNCISTPYGWKLSDSCPMKKDNYGTFTEEDIFKLFIK